MRVAYLFTLGRPKVCIACNRGGSAARRTPARNRIGSWDSRNSRTSIDVVALCIVADLFIAIKSTPAILSLSGGL